MIVDAIRGNNKISLSELAKVIGISQTSIEKNIRILQDENIIKRIGPAKGGRWEAEQNTGNMLGDKLGNKLGDRLGDRLGDQLSKNQQ